MRSFNDLLDIVAEDAEMKARFVKAFRVLQSGLKEKKNTLDELIADFCEKFFDRDDEKQFPIIVKECKEHFQTCMDNANIRIRNQNFITVAEKINSVLVTILAFEKYTNMGYDRCEHLEENLKDHDGCEHLAGLEQTDFEVFEANKLTLRNNLFGDLEEHCNLMKTLIAENSKDTNSIIREKFNGLIQKWIDSLPKSIQTYLD